MNKQINELQVTLEITHSRGLQTFQDSIPLFDSYMNKAREGGHLDTWSLSFSPSPSGSPTAGAVGFNLESMI